MAMGFAERVYDMAWLAKLVNAAIPKVCSSHSAFCRRFCPCVVTVHCTASWSSFWLSPS